MRRARLAISFGFLAFGFASLSGGQVSKGGGGFSELHRAEIAGAPDLEVVMGLIERAGESTGAKHYHPGGEFGLILEGAVSIATEGGSPVILRAGESFHQPAGEWHSVGTDAGGAKTVVFRVVRKGQPMVVGVDEP